MGDILFAFVQFLIPFLMIESLLQGCLLLLQFF